MSETRLIDLEIKFSHHDVAIESLRQEVFDQQKTIAHLEKIVKLLSERVDGGIDKSAIDKKPPHY